MRLLKTMFLSLSLLLVATSGFAQKVSFEANVPAMVGADETFPIEFSLNAKPDQGSFSMSAIAGFDVLAGPTTSQGESYSIVNGNMTHSVKYTFTYVLAAQKPGKYTIPAAEIKVDGKTYTSHPTLIEVVGEGGSRGSAQGNSQSGGQQAKPGGKIAKDDILVRASVTRNSVYKGQPVVVTFKLYNRLPLSGVEAVKAPAFNGFWSQQLDVSNQRGQRESLNNKVYETHIIAQYLLYPQQAGALFVEQFDVTVIAQIISPNRRQSQSVFDDFFNGGPDVQEVRRKLSTSPIRIEVRELPGGAPAGFNGAVGKFSMESVLPDLNINANSAATYTIKITGTGNLPLIQAPKLALPSSFEQYNIKTTESLNSTTAGITGYRQFEYPFIARAEGDFPVNGVVFSYFNPDLVKYISLSSKDIELNILPDSTGGASAARGMVSGMDKEDIKILGQDIRFIKLGSAGLFPIGRTFMGSTLWFVLLLVILGVFAGVLVYLQKRIRESRNVVLMRGKRANKVALQRLRAAESYMKSEDRRGFFEEMLRALWGYMSDKLNIPVANLTKENVREELLKRGVSQEVTTRFIDLITECEYAQYSPAVSGQMNEIYKGALETISKFESVIKR